MFYLFANVNFLPGGYTPWQSAYNILAHHVFLHEPTTQTYYFGIPWDSAFDPPSTSLMLSFEADTNREALYSTHFNSPAMKTFLKAALPHMATDLDLSYWTHVAGFIDADDKAGKDWEEREERECGVMYDVKIICKKGESGVVKDRLVRVAEGVEDDGSNGVDLDGF